MPATTLLLTAGLTGVFCAAFAVIVNTLTDALSIFGVIAVSFASGFMGSLIAQTMLQRK